MGWTVNVRPGAPDPPEPKENLLTLSDPFRLLAAATLSFGLASGVALSQTEEQEAAEQAGEPAAGQDADTGTAADEGAATDEAAEPAAESEGETAEEADAAAEEADADTASDGAEEAEGEASAEAIDATADSPVATINGEPLTLGELIALRRDLPEQYQALPDEVLLQGLTEQLVDQTLLEAAAREAGIDERQDVALSLRNQERAVLADAYLQLEMAERVNADALRQAYEEQYVEAEPVEQIRASHILVESREKADDLFSQLEEGADFAKLAEDHGTDSTATRGGDLGWFAKGDMVPAFGDAAFATEPGEVAGPVETPYGWHLIKVVEKRERPVPEFEEVQQALLEQVTQQAQTAIVQELREKAEVELSEPMLPPAAIRADDLIGAK